MKNAILLIVFFAWAYILLFSVVTAFAESTPDPKPSVRPENNITMTITITITAIISNHRLHHHIAILYQD
jgi:hypothetical protein